jgi:hypothetical protein
LTGTSRPSNDKTNLLKCSFFPTSHRLIPLYHIVIFFCKEAGMI